MKINGRAFWFITATLIFLWLASATWAFADEGLYTQDQKEQICFLVYQSYELVRGGAEAGMSLEEMDAQAKANSPNEGVHYVWRKAFYYFLKYGTAKQDTARSLVFQDCVVNIDLDKVLEQ